MTDLYLTRTRRDLLRAIMYGRVRISGSVVVRHADGGINQRCDAKTRELVNAGWAVLGADGGTYRLTDAGRAVLDGAP